MQEGKKNLREQKPLVSCSSTIFRDKISSPGDGNKKGGSFGSLFLEGKNNNTQDKKNRQLGREKHSGNIRQKTLTDKEARMSPSYLKLSTFATMHIVVWRLYSIIESSTYNGC